MGTYYNPEKVEKHGVRVEKTPLGLPTVKYRLVMVLDRTTRKLAVDVTNRGEYQEFYGQYSMGLWLRYDLYDYDPANEES